MITGKLVGLVFFGVLLFVAEQTNIYIPLWIALIVALPATVTPLLLGYFQQKSRRAEKKEDWKRQDEVAERVKQVAKGVEMRTMQLENLAKGQEVIHSLVDGQMTAAMQSELDTKQALLVSLKEVATLKGETSHEAASIMKAMQLSIDELTQKLAARHEVELKMKE